MTRKFYIITYSFGGGPHTAVTFRAVTSPKADSGATASQIDDIRNSGVTVLDSYLPGIWLRRAAARRAAASLTSATGNPYSVKEVGEFKRTVRPVKGYKFRRPDGLHGHWFLEHWRGPASEAACRACRHGLGPTRALARAALPEQQSAYTGYGNKGKLRIVTVYADAA
jgi:hypothetical protein